MPEDFDLKGVLVELAETHSLSGFVENDRVVVRSPSPVTFVVQVQDGPKHRNKTVVQLNIAMMRGEGAQKAIRLATAKTGPGYRYCITYISYTGSRGAAKVLAYDDRSIKEVQVKW